MFEFKKLNLGLVFCAVLGATALLNAGDSDVQEVGAQKAQEGSLIKDVEQCDQAEVEATITDDEFGLKKKREVVQKNKKKKSKSFDLQDLALAGGGLAVGAVLGALTCGGSSTSGHRYIERHNYNHTKQYYPDLHLVYRGSLFSDLTGVDERAFDPQSLVDGGNGFYVINCQGRQYQCGRIFQECVVDLRENLAAIPAAAAVVPARGSFNIIYLQGGNEAPLRYFADIAALQAHPMNNGAVFQLASRFNALENFCVYKNVFSQAGKPAWMEDFPRRFTPFSHNCGGVQGEEGAFSAAPGGILRMYGPAPINLLRFVDPEHKIYNPFCPVVPGGRAIDQNLDLFRNENWADNLQICFHEGIEVVAGCELYQNTERHYNYSQGVRPGQIIHQIPVSAFNFKHDNKGNTVSLQAQLVAKQLLNATYRGTLLSVITHGKTESKIFLTMVGGGVFYNKREWIADAIYNCRDLIQNYGLKVYLVVWDKLDLNTWFNSGSQQIQTMIETLNGQILYLENDKFWFIPNGAPQVGNFRVADSQSIERANKIFLQFLGEPAPK